MLPAMKKNLAVYSSVALLSFLSACGGGNAAVGNYTLDIEAVKASMKDMFKEMPGGAEMFATMAKDMQGTLELKADGTAVMDQKGGPGAMTTTGTWKVEGDKVSLTAKGPDGKDMTMTGKLAGAVLTLDMPEMMPGKKMVMTFKKK
jgi:hypothetical protein